ncbi:MAG: methyltransferase domain-containing protein, partial [Vicinamibacterales bacterium]
EDGVGLSSSSQPAIMAIMLQQLDLFAGARVLEIGAGTGYNAALMHELAGQRGQIVTIDIDDEVAGWARERLDAAGYHDVVVYCADGADGWPAGAPYDRIILTVGAADITPGWFEQLRDGGRLVLPLLLGNGELSIAFEKDGNRLVSRSVEPCGFMRIRGKLDDPVRIVPINSEVVAATTRADLPVDLLRLLLATPARREHWDGAPYDGFTFFAGLWGLPHLVLRSRDPNDRLYGHGAFGLLDGSAPPSLAVLTHDPDIEGQFELRSWGGAMADERLRAAFERWRDLGRPTGHDITISAHPLPNAPAPAGGQIAIDTRWWRLLVLPTNVVG